ncbi:uncharacterized protein PgNI_09069 [Pyricularia grisea]|uniref:Condensation domain-containing protein n=1 Tax=Pyricularia grisea TaxID=148305 RepID=A0A6P8AT47_PYRGI|nr:uncharacterized protein PgNI_09069 [Pyricularia grisea]TLD05267.1 hypothetical protein PgNI_09069 [Pyricularia grisea]
MARRFHRLRDQVRYELDGALECLGRIDWQICGQLPILPFSAVRLESLLLALGGDSIIALQVSPELRRTACMTCFGFDHIVNVSPDDRKSRTLKARNALGIEPSPMMRSILFSNGNEQILFAVAHHLVMDLVAWRIIIADTEALLTATTVALSLTARKIS